MLKKLFKYTVDAVFYTIFLMSLVGGFIAFSVAVKVIFAEHKKEAREEKINKMIYDDRLKHLRKNKKVA